MRADQFSWGVGIIPNAADLGKSLGEIKKRNDWLHLCKLAFLLYGHNIGLIVAVCSHAKQAYREFNISKINPS